MKIGMIGNDTSHCEIFTRLFNDPSHKYHISGATITHVFPVISEDLEISASRAKGYLRTLTSELNVLKAQSLEQLIIEVDAILLVTVDGRNHLEIMRNIAGAKKPIFIDKPAVISMKDMQQLEELVRDTETPVMSSSALRFSDSIRNLKKLNLQNAYIYGPLPKMNEMPGYFWYGIHMVELVLSLFSSRIVNLTKEKFVDYELVHLYFESGQYVIIRGDYEWHSRFGGIVHTEHDVHTFKLWEEPKPYYASLLEEILRFFETSISPVSLRETARVIDCVERINRL